jgi:hypothetical protein
MHPELQMRIAGHYLGDHVDVAIERVETLLVARPGIYLPRPASREYKDTLQAFGARRAAIESSMNEAIQSKGGSSAYLTVAHKFLGDNILSALQLGDIGYLNSEIDWLNVLLKAQNLNRSVVFDYLGSYSVAVAGQLGEQAAIICGWLDECIRAGKR